jgi:hypothetical protein
MSLKPSRIRLLLVIPLLLVPAAFATTPTTPSGRLPASGTWNDQSLVSLTEYTGPNGVAVEQATIKGVITGSVSGPYTTTSTVLVTSPTQAYYYAVDYCTCTIGGKGPYQITFNELGSLTLSSQGYFVLSSTAVAVATGSPRYDISIQLQGTLSPLTDLSAGSYSGAYTYQA